MGGQAFDSLPFGGWRAFVAAGLLAASLSACATTGGTSGQALSSPAARAYNRPYEVNGRWYRPAEQPHYDEVGLASWYAYPGQRRTTSDGEVFDARLPTAAHTTLPIPSYLEVTNLANGRRVRVRLNDRGPFTAGRLIDVSRAAAEELGFLGQGTARVRVRYLGPAPLAPVDERPMLARVSRRPDAATPAPYVAAAPPPMQAAGAAPAPVLAEAPPLSRPQAAAPIAGGFAVQVGAFADRTRAEAVAVRLAAAGETAILPLDRGGITLYRVTLGSWPSAAAATEAKAQAAALGFPDARIVRAE